MAYKSNVTIEKVKDEREAEVGSLEVGTYFLTSGDTLAMVIRKEGTGHLEYYTDVAYAKDGYIIGMKNDTIVRVVDVEIKVR